MITREQIKELPRKYAIGKRPLSRVLGWGELTYTRLLDGSAPSPQHEEELLRALNKPHAYMMLLEQAHEAGLVSDLTYERSAKAAREHLQEDAEAAKVLKLHAVARFICALSAGDITPHALQLLVYYAHGLSLAKLDEPLVGVQPLASDSGPAYEALAAWFTFERIQEAGAVAGDADFGLSGAERKLVRSAYGRYGAYSASKLQDMACSESPWRKARKRAAEGAARSQVTISAKSMKKFFAKAAK